MELADVTDSKSVGSNTVRVRPPPSAPKKAGLCLNRYSPAFFGAGGVRTRTVRVVQGCTMAVAQSRRKDAPTPTTANARMRDSACPKFRTMRNQQSKHNSTTPPRHTFANSTSGVLFLVRREGEPATCG